MTRKKRILLLATGAVLFLLLVLLVFGGNYLVSFAIGRNNGSLDIMPPSTVSEEDSRSINANWQQQAAMAQEWSASVTWEQAEITSGDGLTLRGEAARFPEGHRWLIGIHGYRGNHRQMLTLAANYGLRGWSVLLPDLRGCGDSEGDYIGMGWPDRKDMLLWIDWILARDPEAQIVLHGVSMGGATVAMTAGEDLPPQVKALVEDCGYTSVWDIFEDELVYLFHLPAFPVLHAASLFSGFRAGYRFTEASALSQVRKANVPMLFIHGEKDNFVSTDMVYPLYEACPAEKELLVVEGAGHGAASSMDPELYYGTVFRFLNRYLMP